MSRLVSSFSCSKRLYLYRPTLSWSGTAVVGIEPRAEFWRRYDQLFVPNLTKYEGNASYWHVIVPNQVEIAISARGQLVARVGFPWNRPNANPVTQEHIPALADALRRLRLQNP